LGQFGDGAFGGIIIGYNQDRFDETVETLSKDGPGDAFLPHPHPHPHPEYVESSCEDEP
jgi:hypothetical protein